MGRWQFELRKDLLRIRSSFYTIATKGDKILGKEGRQTSFFDTGFACSHLIDKKSFYSKMRECADKIITDD